MNHGILELASEWIKSSFKEVKQRDAKILVEMDTEKLAYKMTFVLEEAFGKVEPVQTGKKYPYWYSRLPLATLACKIGTMVLISQPEEDKEKREAKRFRVGYHLLNTLFDEGLLELTKGPNARDAYRVRVAKGKETTFKFLVDLIDKEEAPVPIYTRPQFQEPLPFIGFWHEEAGSLVRNVNEEVITEFTLEKRPKVFDVINKHMQNAYKINTELLDVYAESLEDEILTFSSKDLTEEQLGGLERERDKVLEIATMVGDRKFWEYMFYDNRGRLYSSSVYLSHAGSKLSKSLYLYDEKKPLTSEGYFWLMVHASNCFGYDKDTIDGRHDFAYENLDEWIRIAKDPVNNKEWQDADDPFNFLAAITEIRNSHAYDGGPFDYPSGLPIAWDATCSGLQILSALSRDEVGGRLSNLTDTDKRGDYYLFIADEVWKDCTYTEDEFKQYESISKQYKEMDRKVEKALRSANSERIKEALEERSEFSKENKEALKSSAKVFWGRPEMAELRRKVCKRSCMTYFYSCKPKTMANAMYTDFASEPEFVGLNNYYCFWLSTRIYKTCREKMPRPTKLMDLFIQLGVKDYNNGTDFSLVSPVTEFLFVQDYKDDKTKKVEATYKGKRIQIKIVVAKDHKIDRQKVLSATSPNVVHMLDSQMVAAAILKAEYTVSTIHDSFSTHAADAGKLFEDTRTAFVELFNQDLLEEILQQKECGEMIADVQYGTLAIEETYENENCFS